ncbi:MAG TPA: GAF and ANTAR domain-containing protein [Acidimicrobiales bacterium]|nr:GAF and ANTAR domain-containing protein [Acidimicrobiales bacterium]
MQQASDALAREPDLVRTLVRLADSLVDTFDLLELLRDLSESCTRLLAVDAAGLLLVHEGELRVLGASEERLRLLELFQIQNHEGACLESYELSQPIVVTDLADEVARWPRFAPQAIASGYRATHAIPLRLRDDTIGVLNLFLAAPGALTPDDAVVAQALADTATIAILQHRTVASAELTASQLQTALESRVLIEQAKGIIAERRHLDMEQAFGILRRHARSHHLRLHDVARQVVDDELDLSE